MALERLPEPGHDADLFIKGVPVHTHSWRHGELRFVYTADAAPDGRYHVVTLDGEGTVLGQPVAYATLPEAQQAAAERYAAARHPSGRRRVWSEPKPEAEGGASA